MAHPFGVRWRRLARLRCERAHLIVCESMFVLGGLKQPASFWIRIIRLPTGQPMRIRLLQTPMTAAHTADKLAKGGLTVAFE